jgi:hypothetical protein
LENGWETVAIQEEGDSGDFLFLFLWLLDRSEVEAHQYVYRRNGRPTYNIIVKKEKKILAPLLLVTFKRDITLLSVFYLLSIVACICVLQFVFIELTNLISLGSVG